MKKIAFAAVLLVAATASSFAGGYDDLNIGISYLNLGRYDDAVTWHLQFHGNASCAEDVFLSNGVQAAPATLQTLAAKIAAASQAAAPDGPVLKVGVFDGPRDCALRGTDNMQMRFASGLPHASICADANVPVGPSRFIHVEQRRDARRARDDKEATAGRNRAVVVAGILATFP